MFVKLKVGIGVVLSLIIGSCGIPERPTVITISQVPVFSPSSPESIHSVEQAFAAVITVCRNELGLPTIDPLYIYLYKNTISFALYGRGWRTLPIDVENLIAFAQAPNTIHINLERVGKHPWGDLVPVLAHEYAHLVAALFSGATPRVNVWFSEGFADWIGARVIHFLGWRNYDLSLHAVRRELVRYRDIVPNLSSLNYDLNWSALSQKPRGWIRTYGLAFVAVHKVIEDNSLVTALSYLKTGNFAVTFGRTVDDYAADVENSFTREIPRSQELFAINTPVWKLGDEWIYEKRQDGKVENVITRVMKDSVEGGIPGFIVAENDINLFYSKDGLALTTSTKNGTLTTVRKPANRIFDWPLQPGKESRSQFKLEDLETNDTQAIDRVAVVTGFETVKVPAGTFTAAKIEKYDFKTGRLQREYWYAPEVKWYVKSRSYGNSDVTEEELLRFEVHGVETEGGRGGAAG